MYIDGSQTDRQIDIHIERQRDTNRKTHTHKQKDIDRQTLKADRYIDIHKQKDSQIKQEGVCLILILTNSRHNRTKIGYNTKSFIRLIFNKKIHKF